MDMRDYLTLHLDTNSSKETTFVLQFYISQSRNGVKYQYPNLHPQKILIDFTWISR
jgi:hypothetical protein